MLTSFEKDGLTISHSHNNRARTLSRPRARAYTPMKKKWSTQLFFMVSSRRYNIHDTNSHCDNMQSLASLFFYLSFSLLSSPHSLSPSHSISHSHSYQSFPCIFSCHGWQWLLHSREWYRRTLTPINNGQKGEWMKLKLRVENAARRNNNNIIIAVSVRGKCHLINERRACGKRCERCGVVWHGWWCRKQNEFFHCVEYLPDQPIHLHYCGGFSAE